MLKKPVEIIPYSLSLCQSRFSTSPFYHLVRHPFSKLKNFTLRSGIWKSFYTLIPCCLSLFFVLCCSCDCGTKMHAACKIWEHCGIVQWHDDVFLCSIFNNSWYSIYFFDCYWSLNHCFHRAVITSWSHLSVNYQFGACRVCKAKNSLIYSITSWF